MNNGEILKLHYIDSHDVHIKVKPRWGNKTISFRLTKKQVMFPQIYNDGFLQEMLNQYNFENTIDFNEIDSVSNNFNENGSMENRSLISTSCYKKEIVKDVFFNNTNVYNFKSCFKDRNSLIAAFDRHSGQVSNVTYPYDINETPETEKVKRFYRKSISDPSLHSWYQYSVISSRRFSKQENDENVSKSPIERYPALINKEPKYHEITYIQIPKHSERYCCG